MQKPLTAALVVLCSLSLAGFVSGQSTVSSTPAQTQVAAAPQVVIPREKMELIGVATVNKDGKKTSLMAVRSTGGSVIRFYDLNGKLERSLSLPPEVMLSVRPALSPDGQWLAVALDPDQSNREARVGVLSTSAPVYNVIFKDSGLQGTTTFAFNGSNTRLIIGNRNSYVQTWDIQNSKRLNTVMGKGPVQTIRFSPDGELFVPYFAQGKDTVMVSANTGVVKGTLPGAFPGSARPLMGGMVFLGPGKVRSIVDGQLMPLPAFLIEGATPVSFDDNGQTVIVQLPRSLTFERREVMTGEASGGFTLKTPGAVQLSPDGRQALVQNASGDWEIKGL